MRKIMPVLFVVGLIILTMGLFISGDKGRKDKNPHIAEEKAFVLQVDDSGVVSAGISRIGFQKLLVELKSGQFKGQKVEATNQLMGKLELDDYYQPGDKIIVAVSTQGKKIQMVKALNIYRQGWQLVMFAVFVLASAPSG